mgnify:FL=1
MKKIMLSIIALVSSISMVQAQTYKIGDVYDKGGVKGVVFYVDDSGEHGLLVSPSGFEGKWCKKEQANNTINCYDEKDGAVNMETIATYIKDNDASWDEFPLFQWARSLGEGWYIPASDELKLLAKAINGGEEYSEKNINKFAKILKKEKGQGFINKGLGHSDDFMNIYSSTEMRDSQGLVFSLFFQESSGSKFGTAMLGKFAKRKGKLILAPQYKDTNILTEGFKTDFGRAVHKF